MLKVKAKSKKIRSPLPVFHTGGNIGIELRATELITLYNLSLLREQKLNYIKKSIRGKGTIK
jgi:hypothetical protein